VEPRCRPRRATEADSNGQLRRRIATPGVKKERRVTGFPSTRRDRTACRRRAITSSEWPRPGARAVQECRDDEEGREAPEDAGVHEAAGGARGRLSARGGRSAERPVAPDVRLPGGVHEDADVREPVPGQVDRAAVGCRSRSGATRRRAAVRADARTADARIRRRPGSGPCPAVHAARVACQGTHVRGIAAAKKKKGSTR